MNSGHVNHAIYRLETVKREIDAKSWRVFPV